MNTRKRPNRFFAILLSVCMFMTMLPAGSIAAFAEENPEVISENTIWNDDRILSNNVQIAGGVTLTINGAVTIEGAVTISGGGSIVRRSGNAYFNIGSGSLTLDGVTVDGNGISSGNSMFDVIGGMLALKNSTVQNCVKSEDRGGAVNMEGGVLTIESTTITNCSAAGYGGAIYLRDGANAEIKSGTFSGNKTTALSQYGGGFIYNRSMLTIEDGTFENNSSTGKGGAIYNAGTAGTEAYILGGVFSGNTSSCSGYEGSGAVYYSSENTADTILNISGKAKFGTGEAGDGTDGIYLDISSTGAAPRKMQVSSALQYPVNIYVACSEGRAIAQGVEGYTLTAADMTKIQFHDVGSSGGDWYAWLDSEKNEVDVSGTEPIYVVYDANGAAGSVTDNTVYSTGSEVTVQAADTLTYEGYTFTGWNTSADGTGTPYQPNEIFEIIETTTLYAQWEIRHQHNICGGTECGHDGHTAVIYSELGNDLSGKTLPEGNYYLTEDITNIEDSIEITGRVNLCLNGHEISGDAEDGILRIGKNGVLNVCDCAGNGKITETGSTGHNPIFLHSGGELNLYSGTIASRITAVVIDEDPSSGVYDPTGGTVNVYGGTVSSSGSGSQAIKVNADMTNAAVNIYGGELTSPNRGIWASSGEISIYGGTITGDVETNGNVTMTAGTINGQLTIDKVTINEKKIVKISGDAKIETTSGNAVYSDANVDIEISGGTIIAKDGYAVFLTMNLSRIYLSGSPVISGESADLGILPASNASDAVLVPHAKDTGNGAYTGSGCSISSYGTYYEDKYVAQGVESTEIAEKFSLADLSGYYLEYDDTNKALQIKEIVYYDVTLPSGEGYTVAAESGSSSPVLAGENYSFTVTVDSKNKYYKTDDFAVKSNDTVLTPDADGVYTISNIGANQTVTVEGVAQDNAGPTAKIQIGENEWNTFLDDITFDLFFKDTQTVTVSAADNETGIEKIEYFISDTPYADSQALEAGASGGWTACSGDISISPNSKNIIYVKAADNAGNVSYASSNGIVLYTDAAQDTQSVSFTKTVTADITAKVTLNGNTIDKICCGDDKLVLGEDYSIEDGMITFKAGWLDTLLAGNYTLTVHYDPLGTDYVQAAGNDAPGTTTIALSVQKAAGSVEITNDISKVFDGNVVEDIKYNRPSAGAVTVEYKARNAGDDSYTTEKPSAVGEYTVRVSAAADENYTEAAVTADFEITYLAAPEVAYTLDGTKGDNGWYISDVTITPSEGYMLSEDIDGEYTENLTVSQSAEDIKIYLKNGQGQMTGAVSVGEIRIDKDPPEIIMSENTAAYYTTQKAAVTDDNLASVMLGSEPAILENGVLTLPGNTDTTYIITASDKAGNSTTVKVEMRSIAGIIDDIDGLTEENVTSADEETIDEIKTIAENIDIESATEEEKAALQDIIGKCDELLDKISETQNAGNTENIQNIQDIKPDNVKPEDKEELQAAKDELEQILNDYADNYTEDEKQRLEETLDQVKDALEVVANVERAEAAINALPESINADDVEEKEIVDAAKEQYDALSEYEKSLVSDEAVEKLNALLEQIENDCDPEEDPNPAKPSDSKDIPSAPADETQGSSETGDTSHIVFWSMLAIASGSAAVILGLRRKK
jgi:uncharacterized repeat protein (TIGR02543 family)